MRVAIWNDLPGGGGKRALYDHVEGLLRLGHVVESWCTSSADQQFLRLGDLCPEHVVPLDLREQEPFRQRLSGLTGRATTTYAVLRAMDRHVRHCAEDINRRGFDVVLAGGSSWLAVPPLARYLRAPSVLYLQEPYRLLYEALPRFRWAALPKRRLSRESAVARLRDAAMIHGMRIQAREESDNIRAFDRVLANSYFSRESILRAYGTEPRVCYLGVDIDRYKDRGLPRKRMVVGIGGFVLHKRVEVAIRAVSALASPKPSLTWIGNVVDEGYLADLVASARDLGVDFAPLVSVPHHEVVDVLNEASVMVYAPRLEPFGYAPLEAAACGLPVVAKAEGGIRESVVHGVSGLLVDRDEDLARALQRLVTDEDEARRMGAAARRLAESNWSTVAASKRLESYLMEVVKTS